MKKRVSGRIPFTTLLPDQTPQIETVQNTRGVIILEPRRPSQINVCFLREGVAFSEKRGFLKEGGFSQRKDFLRQRGLSQRKWGFVREKLVFSKKVWLSQKKDGFLREKGLSHRKKDFLREREFSQRKKGFLRKKFFSEEVWLSQEKKDFTEKNDFLNEGARALSRCNKLLTI